jgi:hypothetical protein
MKENNMAKLSDFYPQKKNANLHTEQGLALLERSIQQDGFIGAITATANGEIIAGSARLEKVADVLPAEPIVVECDGTRPIIIKRIDIPNAEDERAKRLAISDNRIAELNLNWDTGLIQELEKEIDLSGMNFNKLFYTPINKEHEVDNQNTLNECPQCHYRW